MHQTASILSPSYQFHEIFGLHVDITDYLSEDSSVQFFAGVVRNDRGATVRMLKKNVTALLSKNLESELRERFKDLSGR
jgi:hypothetical protein